MSNLKHLTPSLEAIAFQGDAYHKELTLVFSEYVGKGMDTRDYAKLSAAVEKTIKKYTNASIDFVIERGYDPCIQLRPLDASSLFMKYWGALAVAPEDIKRIRTMSKTFASVDLAKSKVHGAFEESLATIYMGPEYITEGKFTAGELSAITLHENGHYFGMCEMMDRTCGTNQILASIDRCLKNNTDVKKRKMILEYGGEALDLEDRVIQQAKESADDTVATSIFVIEAARNLKFNTDQGKAYYEQNHPEYTSDEFAARHGAGRDLITGLDKLFSTAIFGLSVIEKRSTAAYIGIEILKVAMLVAGTWGAAATGVGFLLAAPLSLIMADSSDLGEPTYDGPLGRLNRIRAQFIEQSKNGSLNRNIAKQLLEDVRVIDKLLAEYTQRRDVLSFLSDTLSLTGNVRNRNYQRELEKLVLNDLFLKALDFKS